ncbi:MAG: hypothetical protein H6519_04245 [Microthrixaceae bacterium]|nr:hypothetical protein [Microthrixaceae bacterium]
MGHSIVNLATYLVGRRPARRCPGRDPGSGSDPAGPRLRPARQLTLDVDRGLLDIGTINPFTVAPNDGSGEPS